MEKLIFTIDLEARVGTSDFAPGPMESYRSIFSNVQNREKWMMVQDQRQGDQLDGFDQSLNQR